MVVIKLGKSFTEILEQRLKGGKRVSLADVSKLYNSTTHTNWDSAKALKQEYTKHV